MRSILCWTSLAILVSLAVHRSFETNSPTQVHSVPSPVVPESSSNDGAEVPAAVSLTPSADSHGAFPESVTIEAGGKRIEARLSGGYTCYQQIPILPIRIPVYLVSSYVEVRPGEPFEPGLDDLVEDDRTKVLVLRYVRWLHGSWITSKMWETVDDSFDDVDVERLRSNIEFFVDRFANGSNEGDETYIVWLPGGRSYCSFDDPDAISLVAVDVPLARAIWRIWAGSAKAERLLDRTDPMFDRDP